MAHKNIPEEELRKLIDSKIRIFIGSDQEAYDGVLKYIDIDKKKLSLIKVTAFPSGKKFLGQQNFFFGEIQDCKVLDANTDVRKGKKAGQKHQETKGQVPETSENQRKEVQHNSNDILSAKLRDQPEKRSDETPPMQRRNESKGAESTLPSYNSEDPYEGIQQGHRNINSLQSIQNTENIERTQPKKLTSSWQPQNYFQGQGRGMGVMNQKSAPPRNVAGTDRKPRRRKKLYQDVSDRGPSLLQRDPLVPDEYLNNHFSEDNSHNLLVNPPEVIFIKEFDTEFEKAVAKIQKQRVIGLACEGVNIGRLGKLCFLQVGCCQAVYIFDILQLGGSCFDEGLTDILQDKNILKVIHDCRQLSDLLLHQYGTYLINIFDTQVADIVIFKQERAGELPRYVNGLVFCLYEYLSLTPEQCHFDKVKLSHTKLNENIWEERPVPQKLLHVLTQEVMFLRELRLAQMERLMAEFLYGVDLYLKIVRDESDQVLRSEKTNSKLVPGSFQELSRFDYRNRTKPFEQVPNDKHLDNEQQRHTWYNGQAFAEAYENKPGRLIERRFVHDEPAIETIDEVDRFEDEPSVEDQSTAHEEEFETSVSHDSDKDLSGTTDSSYVESSPAPSYYSSFRNFSPHRSVLANPKVAESIFSDGDFPPLSSSDSEVSESSLQQYQEKPTNSSSPSPISMGRGRAHLLLHNAALPSARLPHQGRPVGAEGKSFISGQFKFPSDIELFDAPEVVSVKGLQTRGTPVQMRLT